MNLLTKRLLTYYPMSFKPVTKYTRAGQHGKYLQCPKCQSVRTIYHFSWSGLTCPDCKESIDKLDWLVESN